MTAHRFYLNGGGRLELGAGVLLVMQRYVQDAPDKPEGGGILLGRFLLNSRDVVVDQVTVPMAKDRRTRYSYHRAQERHQRIIDRRWHESNGTCGYLGEWHTHPEPVPTPSTKDLRNWRKKLKTDVFDGDTLFFIIVGQREIRAWQGSRGTRYIALLRIDLPVKESNV